jgi:hypothetical protein
LISLTLRKIARFQIENCGRATRSLRMGTNYDLKGLALRINASPFNGAPGMARGA